MNTALTPTQTALHILATLREDVGAFPERLTPKYPLPAVMRTETQITLMDQFGEAGGCNRECLGVTDAEVNALRRKGIILRARFLFRKAKRGEASAQDASLLQMLVSDLVAFGEIALCREIEMFLVAP